MDSRGRSVSPSHRGSSPLSFIKPTMLDRRQHTPDSSLKEKYSDQNNYGFGKADDIRKRARLGSLHTSDNVDPQKLERVSSPEKSSTPLRRRDRPPPFQDIVETVDNPIKAMHALPSTEAEPETLTKELKSDEGAMVTVFGLPPSQAENIVKEFKNLGEIVNFTWGPGESNYVHLQYKDPQACQRALQRHGSLIGGSIVGVMPYSIFQRSKQGPSAIQINYGGLRDAVYPMDGYKSMKPLLQQPISVVTRDVSPIPKPQSWFSIIMEYIFGF